jgi:hypothetical protein
MKYCAALVIVSMGLLTACGGGEDGAQDQDPVKDGATQATLEAIAAGMDLYRAKFKKYPIADAPALVLELEKEGMIDDVEVGGSEDSGPTVLDAYGHAVQYKGDETGFTFTSPGANGKFGDADDIEVKAP